MKCKTCKGRKCADGCGKIVCYHTAKIWGKDTRRNFGEKDTREYLCMKCRKARINAMGWKADFYD